MKTLTRVKELIPGDKFYLDADEATIVKVETMPMLDGRAYDDYRGNGDYLRVTCTIYGTPDRLIRVLDFPPNGGVYAGEGL